MRKPTRPRLAQDDAPAALLDRIHALAQGLDDYGCCDSERETVRFLSQHLKPGEVCLARHAHDLLQAEMAKVLEACGYVEPDEVELLRALKDFAELSEWAYENGRWTTRADRVQASADRLRASAEAAHA